jgi:polo-like kinase 1
MDEAKSFEKDDAIDQAIIEEKITKTNGEVTIKKYSKGKSLGLGGFTLYF